jgi:hypothetical protein
MARINRESITTLIVDARPAAAGAAEFDRASAKIKNAASASQRIIERTNVMLGEQSKQFKRLVRDIDPAALAQEKFAKHLKTLDTQFKGNTGLPEYTRLLKLLEAKYKDTGNAAVEAAAKQQAAFTKMRAKYDPLFAANEKYKAELRDLMEAHAAGAVDEPNFRREHARIEQDFNPANISARKLAEAEAKLAIEQKKAADAAADHARKVDLLRARFNPAFAVTLKFRDALRELADAERMGALTGAALEAEIQRVFDTLHPTAVAARELAEADAKLAKEQQLAADKAAIEARALETLRAKFDPAFAATQRYKAALIELNKAATTAGLRGKPLADALDRIERELNPLNIATAKAAAAQAELAKRAQAVTERMDPLQRVQRQYNEAIREAQELHWKGALSLKDYEKAVAHAAETANRARAAIHALNDPQASSGSSNSRLMTQLAPQISDIVSQLASGSSPVMILAQQGPQIADIFGGIPKLLRAIPPHVYAISAAFIAMGVAAYVTASRMSEIAKQSRTLESIGRTLNPQIAGMAANLRGLTLAMTTEGVSRADATKAVEQLARTRLLQAEMLGSITSITPDVMGALGTDAPGAAKELGEAFSTGSNGVRALNEKLHFLSPTLMRTIEHMDRSGDRIGAMKLAMQELTKVYEGEGNAQMSAWERMTTSMGNAWDALWEKIAGSPQAQAFMRDFANVADMIARALGKVSDAGGNAGRTIAATTGEVAALSQEIFRLQKEANAAQAEGFRLMDAGDPGADAELERAADLARQMQEAQKKLIALRQTPAAPGVGKMEALDSRGLTPDEQIRVDHDIDLYREETKAIKENRIERQIALAGHQAYEAARSRNASHAEAEAFAETARTRARRDIATAINDENQMLDLNIEHTNRVARAWLESGDAGRVAAAEHKAAADNMTTGAQAAARAIRLLKQAAAESYLAGAQAINDLEKDVANLRDIAVAAQGSVPDEMETRRKVEAEGVYRGALSDAQALKDPAERTEKVAEVLALRDAYLQTLRVRDQNNAAISVASQLRRPMENELQLVEKEGQLIGATVEQRQTEIGLLQMRQALIAAGYKGTELDAEAAKLEKILRLREDEMRKTRLRTEQHEREKQAVNDTLSLVKDGFTASIIEGEKFNDILHNMSKAFAQLALDILIWEPIQRMLRESMDAAMYGSGNGGGMTAGSYTPGKGTGAWGTIGSVIQTGLNLYSGWSAGTGPSQMPNAATDSGALSVDALKANVAMFPLAHTGWEVGKGQPPQTRAAPASVFVNAPRLHKGGLLPGERAIIAQDGEEILNASNPRHRRNFRGAGGVNVTMNISTPDANSFRQSQGQITASAARSLAIANRRFG